MIGKRTLVLAVLTSLLGVSSAFAQSPFPAAVGFVESTSPPIRVYYADVAKETLAGTVLTAATAAWAAQVDGMGFAPPMTLDDTLTPMMGLRIYLENRSDIGGMTEAIADLPETPATDCATIIIIADAMAEVDGGETAFHEFNHASQIATDCIESMFAGEQVTVAVTALHNPDDWLLPTALPDFQRAPNHSLDYVDYGSYYHFGAALFSLFLEEVYGARDGKLLAAIWAHTPQNGTVTVSDGEATPSVDNEPDLLDAMRATLAERGVSFDDAFQKFSVYRYFTGSFDDGEHLRNAGDWSGSEVHLDARHFIDELPLSNEVPHAPPEDLGATYVAFDLTGAAPDSMMRLVFQGGTDVLWRATVLGVGSDPTVELSIPLDANQSGVAHVPISSGLNRLVLVAANLGTPEHDPDDMDWVPTLFAYSAALLDCGPMTIASPSPTSVTAGDSTVVTLTGDGFPDDQTVTATVSGEGVSVSRVVRRDAGTLDVTIDTSDSAAHGQHELTIKSECGFVATAVLEVTGRGGCAAMHPQLWTLVGLFGVLSNACRRNRPRA